MLIFLVFVCVVFGIAAYVLLFNGMLSGESSDFGMGRVRRLRELPAGCLVSLIVAGAVWFVLWGIVLILALRLLRTPLGN